MGYQQFWAFLRYWPFTVQCCWYAVNILLCYKPFHKWDPQIDDLGGTLWLRRPPYSYIMIKIIQVHTSTMDPYLYWYLFMYTTLLFILSARCASVARYQCRTRQRGASFVFFALRWCRYVVCMLIISDHLLCLVVWNIFLFFHILGMSSSQLTKSYFSEG